MSPLPSEIPTEVVEEMKRLMAECEKFDRKGLHDTVHHEMLARLTREYGDLIAPRKIEDKRNVKHGKQNL